MSTVSSNRTYAIYGDNVTNVATIVPSLNAVAKPNSILQTSSDINRGSTWQNVVLLDDVQEFVPEYQFPVSEIVNPDETSGVSTFNITTKGPTDMTKMAFQFEYTRLEIGNQTEGITSQFSWSELLQGEYCFLDALESVELNLGNNNFQMLDFNIANTKAMKLHLITRKKTPFQKSRAAQFGITESRGMATSQYIGLGNTKGDPYDNEFDKTFSFNGNLANPDFFSRKISFILGDLFPFFDQANTYLPSSCKMTIKFFWKRRNYPLIGSQSGTTPSVEQYAIINVGPIKNFAFYSEYLVPRKEWIDNFNRKTILQPLVYNYNRYQVYNEEFDGVKKTIQKLIIVNQQRPLQLIFWITLRTGVEDQVVLLTNNGQSNVIKPYSSATGIVYKFINVYVNGRQIVDNRNQTYTTTNSGIYGNSIYELPSLVQASYNAENEHETDGDFSFLSTKMASPIFGSPYIIPINPNLNFKRGVFSTDQGSVNIDFNLQVETTAGLPLPSSFELNIYTVTPAQIQFDASLNVSEVRWPAILAENGIILNRTVNTN